VKGGVVGEKREFIGARCRGKVVKGSVVGKKQLHTERTRPVSRRGVEFSKKRKGIGDLGASAGNKGKKNKKKGLEKGMISHSVGKVRFKAQEKRSSGQ